MFSRVGGVNDLRFSKLTIQVGNSARDRSRGLGLGLAIVRRIVRLLGLTLDLRSRPGHGSCLALQLPRPGPAEIATIAEPSFDRMASGPTMALSGMTVAVIEDDTERACETHKHAEKGPRGTLEPARRPDANPVRHRLASSANVAAAGNLLFDDLTGDATQFFRRKRFCPAASREKIWQGWLV